MKAIIIRENDNFRFMNLDNQKEINVKGLSLRSRLNSGNIKYYQMDISEETLKGIPPIVFLETLNKYPNVADKTDLLIQL